MPPTARWPLSCPVLQLRPPGRGAGSRGRTQRAQQVVDGAQLHLLHRRRRAFLVRYLGAEAGLVDDDAAEFVFHDDGVAGVRPFRVEQRHFGGFIHRFPALRRCRTGVGASAQSSGSIFTIRWSWLLPTQNVVGVVELSTNTVRILVSDGIRYCTALPVLGSSRTTRSVCLVDAQISPFLSKLARYGYVRAGSSYSVNFSVLVSNTATLLPRYSVTVMRSWSSMFR